MLTYRQLLDALPEAPLTRAPELPFARTSSGKVRELYDLGDALLLLATDRVSAFDVIMNEGVAGKGIILTQLSRYWFEQSRRIVRNHLLPRHDELLAERLSGHEELIPRSLLVHKLEPLPIEAVVRAYLSGSGWRDYRASGRLFGQELPEGMTESDALPAPMFTPTTKAHGGHDEPLTLDRCRNILGEELFDQVVQASFELFRLGSSRAAAAGLILADTKFEFGLDENGDLVLIDEILTPDSSRFWPKEAYSPGGAQHAFDKQYLRDYLDGLAWDKSPPPPEVPAEVLANTRARYLEAYEKLTANA